MFDENSRVQRHVIDALLRLMLDHVEQVVGSELFELFVPFSVGPALHRLVNRDCAYWYWRRGDDRAPYAIDVAAGRQIHHRIGTVLHSDLQLLDLAVDI